jgi:hypothetical protein
MSECMRGDWLLADLRTAQTLILISAAQEGLTRDQTGAQGLQHGHKVGWECRMYAR